MSLLILGAGGQVGGALLAAARRQRRPAIGLTHAELDIRDADRVAHAVARDGVGVVVNAAAFTGVDAAEDAAGEAFAVNRDGVANLARACARHGRPLLHLSTDYVFDGSKAGAYLESDRPAPLGVYGASKLAGETALSQLWPAHVILRTSWVFDAGGRNFVSTVRALAARDDGEIRIVNDQTGCPTAAADIAVAMLEIAARIETPEAGCWGTYHFCGRPRTTWYGFARAILPEPARHRLRPISSADYPSRARRPANSVLDCRRIRRRFGLRRPDWRHALAAVLAACDRAPPR